MENDSLEKFNLGADTTITSLGIGAFVFAKAGLTELDLTK
jgi:hypothetical protein